MGLALRFFFKKLFHCLFRQCFVVFFIGHSVYTLNLLEQLHLKCQNSTINTTLKSCLHHILRFRGKKQTGGTKRGLLNSDPQG